MMRKLLFLFLIIPFAISSQTIYVDINASGSNDGSDWVNAYNNLQTAITNVGSNTTINVAQGMYYTTSTTDRTISFNIPSGVKIFGGFPTGGGEKNHDLYPTVLSGDIGVPDDNTDNAYHVVVFGGTNSSTEIDSFIIEKGYADGSGSNESNGGGIFISTVDYGDSNAFIRNCTIRDNYAVGSGGGVLVSKRAEIYNCKVYSNRADSSGGGIYININGRVYNSYIVNNIAGSQGGGIRVTGFNSAPKVINCIIANNESISGAGAYLNEGILNNCTITNNKGNSGVQLYTYGATYNCIIWGNEASQISPLRTDASLKNNLIQNIETTGTNIGVSNKNKGSIFNENYLRFTQPTTFTGNAISPEQLEEILNANWYISPQSAAIDFGDNTTYPTTANTPIIDIAGNNRTINTTMDAGAFEAKVNIETMHATSQFNTSATLQGEILFAETSNTIHRGFVYSEASDFDVSSATKITSSENALGLYSENITDLTEGEFYYYRAWSEIDGDNYYGNEIKFNTSSLVAYYPFNGNSNDESGNGNHGAVNGATLTTDRYGGDENAYSFDGNDGIDITSNDLLNFENELSLSIWIKLPSLPASDVIIIGKSNYYTATNYLLRLRGDGRLQFEYKINSFTSTIPIILNQWNHILVMSNGMGDVTFFINGVESVTSAPNSSPYGLVTNPLTIGYSSRGAEYFNGSIDDIKIYRKTLTLEEISNESLDLIAHYPFEGNANDESGFNNNGTPFGANLTTDRFGTADNAYYFDGINDYIICDTEVGPFGTSSRTISFWAKTDVVPDVNNQQNAVLSYGGNINIGGSRFEILLNPKYRGLGVDVSSKYITKEFDNSDNGWHKYTIVLDNTESTTLLSDIKFYADGNIISNTCNTNGDISINTLDEQRLNIGRLFYTGQPRYFKGSIDEIKIYNKALTSTEISDLYNYQSLGFSIEDAKHKNDFYVSDKTLFFRNSQELNEIKRISIYNMLGQKVFETSKIKEKVELNYLENGTYLLKIVRDNNKLDTGKFIVR